MSVPNMHKYFHYISYHFNTIFTKSLTFTLKSSIFKNPVLSVTIRGIILTKSIGLLYFLYSLYAEFRDKIQMHLQIHMPIKVVLIFRVKYFTKSKRLRSTLSGNINYCTFFLSFRKIW